MGVLRITTCPSIINCLFLIFNSLLVLIPVTFDVCLDSVVLVSSDFFFIAIAFAFEPFFIFLPLIVRLFPAWIVEPNLSIGKGVSSLLVSES